MNELVNCSANARRSCFGAITLRDRSGYSSVSSTIEGSPVHLFSNSTPLFEKEPYAILFGIPRGWTKPILFSWVALRGHSHRQRLPSQFHTSRCDPSSQAMVRSKETLQPLAKPADARLALGRTACLQRSRPTRYDGIWPQNLTSL
jgi:hypothetical protein